MNPQSPLPNPTETPSAPPGVPPSASATQLLTNERDGGAVPHGGGVALPCCGKNASVSSAFGLLPGKSSKKIGMSKNLALRCLLPGAILQILALHLQVGSSQTTDDGAEVREVDCAAALLWKIP